MAFQSAVELQQGFGVIGELMDSSPVRSQSFTIVSGSAANNVFGRAFTVTSQGEAAAGGTNPFAGILANPKSHASYGTVAGGTLAATLTLANETQAELVSEGSLIVTLGAAADVGDLVYYTNATGILTTTAPGAAAPASSTLIKGAYVDRFDLTTGLAVITLSPNSRSGEPLAA
jgi:uncharacterized membrane protein YebE (DUF533 family)